MCVGLSACEGLKRLTSSEEMMASSPADRPLDTNCRGMHIYWQKYRWLLAWHVAASNPPCLRNAIMLVPRWCVHWIAMYFMHMDACSAQGHACLQIIQPPHERCSQRPGRRPEQRTCSRSPPLWWQTCIICNHLLEQGHAHSFCLCEQATLTSIDHINRQLCMHLLVAPG